MNYKLVAQVLGKVLLLELVLMLPSLIVCFIYGEGDANSFVITMLVLLVVGYPLSRFKSSSTKMFARDGIMIVALCWILLSVFGALPFYLSGEIPNYIDALFETISGFTTTGSSILTNVEELTHGIIFWRSFTHWFGGMGVLVFTLALIPSMNGRTQHILKAESPGPAPGKLVPKIADTAKILYVIYFVMTLACILCLVLARMPLFDSLIHAFGAAGTGGFSNKALSIGYYNSVPIEIILGVFMLLFGVNFTIYFHLIHRKFKDCLKNQEVRFYFSIVIVAVLLITLNITHMSGSFWHALRQAFFQVSTIITTTGYATADFNLWPTFSKLILVALMFMGACAGSTAGGMKQIRILVILKAIKRSLHRLLHPRAVRTIKIDGKPIEDEMIMDIGIFFTIYIGLMVVAMFLVSLDNFDFETTFTSVLATTSNIGPGLGVVGPMGSFADFSWFSKLVLSFCMLAGRLEIFPILVFFQFSSWKKA